MGARNGITTPGIIYVFLTLFPLEKKIRMKVAKRESRHRFAKVVYLIGGARFVAWIT